MAHQWQFVRAGGVDQVVMRHGADIAHIAELDQKLWVALACPTHGVEFDARTLALIDSDGDGRIRPPELIAACQWACRRLRDPDWLTNGGTRLSLVDFAIDTPEGAALHDEARHLLGLLPEADGESLVLEQVAEYVKQSCALPLNGDAVVTPQSTGEAALRALIEQVMQAEGGQPDRSGDAGIGRPQLDAFIAQAEAQRTWRQRPLAEPALAPLGAQSLAAVRAVHALRIKACDHFARCRLAAFDALAMPALNPDAQAYRDLSGTPLAPGDARLRELPLASIAPHQALPLRPDGVNPAWAGAVEAFWRDAVVPWRAAFGRGGDAVDAPTMAEHEWAALCTCFAPALAWLAEQPAGPLAAFDDAALAAALDPAMHQALFDLIAEDEAAGPRFGRMAELEKLLLFQRDLLPLLNNFVSFISFYRRERAIFQAGTLYLDARSCDLTIRVPDPARHAPLAGLAKTCLAYCECRRGSEKMNVVAAFTAGDVDFLFVGRNGVFYDRQGRDWDATITRLIENPTSIGQAFFSPYKKFLRMVEEQVAKRAAASDAAVQGQLGSVAGQVAQTGNAGQAAVPAATASAKMAPAPVATSPVLGLASLGGSGSRFDVGTVAALGVALGSLSAVLVAVFGRFVDLGWWIPIALLGIVLAISGPSMLIAWLKLRQRSLGPLLDASGWAINGRMRVNMRLGASLSQSAALPAHAHHSLHDPFAERRGPAYAALAAALVLGAALLLWHFGVWARLLVIAGPAA